jgi:copper resistance protein D
MLVAAWTQLFVSQQDAASSELRHHLAGWFVVLAGVFLLAEPTLRKRWPPSRYAWPLCFLICGLFLLVFSDEELWPLGPVSWVYGLTHTPEDLQHKIFAVILIVLGAIELQRARGRLASAWSAVAFPILALVGSIMLVVHQHEFGMSEGNSMALMERVQAQHVNLAIAGGGIAIGKGLSEIPTKWQAIFQRCWPVLLFVLGVLLIRYVES